MYMQRRTKPYVKEPASPYEQEAVWVLANLKREEDEPSKKRISVSIAPIDLTSAELDQADMDQEDDAMDVEYSNDAAENDEPMSPSSNGQYKNGPWTEEEHHLFMEGMKVHGNDWVAVSKFFVKTRSRTQVGSHAQTWRMQQEKKTTTPIKSPTNSNMTFVQYHHPGF